MAPPPIPVVVDVVVTRGNVLGPAGYSRVTTKDGGVLICIEARTTSPRTLVMMRPSSGVEGARRARRRSRMSCEAPWRTSRSSTWVPVSSSHF